MNSPFQHACFLYVCMPRVRRSLCALDRVLMTKQSHHYDVDLHGQFRRGYDNFGFYDYFDIMTEMVWSQGGHTVSLIVFKVPPEGFHGETASWGF